MYSLYIVMFSGPPRKWSILNLVSADHFCVLALKINLL